MNLAPCPRCRRHVDAAASVCPFCATSLSVVPRLPRVSAVGKLSRAAIFAGAAACGSSTPAAHGPPPPPDQSATSTFAEPPPPAPGKAGLRGVVTRDGQPVANTVVHIARADGLAASATTDEHGAFVFTDLEPGEWNIELDESLTDPDRYSRRPQDRPPTRAPLTVELRAGATERKDFAFSTPPPPPPDDGPCCKPYGAPPARRRVV